MKIGKQTKINLEANKILKRIYLERGINYCELNFYGCAKTWALAWAHRHRRIWYYKKPELLSSFNQTIVACTSCHQKIDSNKELLEESFNKLRGKENA